MAILGKKYPKSWAGDTWKSLQIHNLHLMKSQRPSGGFCYNSFMVFGELDHFEKTGPTNTLLKVAKS